MGSSNHQDVLDQLRSFGLHVETLRIGETRPVRCRVEGGGREQRGWYILHELHTQQGDLLIVGSYGQWRGNENHAQKVEIRKDAFSAEQREALTRRLKEDRRRLEQQRKAEQAKAAERAAAMWKRLSPTGESAYLARKGVQAHGLRFTPNNCAALPLLDAGGKVHGLQFLRTAAEADKARRPAKEFWPQGLAKKGHFHLVGSPAHLVLVAEGYATAASLHEATGYPVAVAFDAGNLGPVAVALRKRHPRTRILLCADDDRWTDANPGITAASTAALEVGGAFLVPTFEDDEARDARHATNGHKDTDFNDLHRLEGLHVVRTQVEGRLSELQWAAPVRAASPPIQRGEGSATLRPVEQVDDLLKRYALVYAHSGAVFDRQEHILMSLSDMRDVCTHKDLHRRWVESPRREIVRIRNVGFDPTLQDPEVTCNLYAGWPTVPKAGPCDRLLDLLRYMCSGDRNANTLYEWVLRWIAYPLQHPGAKMKSTLVVHGPQGTGKNLFFEVLSDIYGEYGDVLDQSAVEDKFNDWASRKLFMIADEVIARSDVYHIKNKLKALITGDRIRINPKNFAAYWERNHLNMVFLSNESMPVVLEEDDRRHCVIWTPEKLSIAYYRAVMDEIRDGGTAALHHYLLHLDLIDFNPGTLPPETAAKAELIGLALDSPLRFYDDLHMGEILGLRAMPGLSTDWYAAYKIWCTHIGVRAAPENKFAVALERRRRVQKDRRRYLVDQDVRGPHTMLMLGDATPPEDRAETTWLGEQVGACRRQLDDYRGRA